MKHGSEQPLASLVAPLLTGYEGFLPFAPFEDENAFGRGTKTGREGGEDNESSDPLANDFGGIPPVDKKRVARG